MEYYKNDKTGLFFAFEIIDGDSELIVLRITTGKTGTRGKKEDKIFKDNKILKKTLSRIINEKTKNGFIKTVPPLEENLTEEKTPEEAIDDRTLRGKVLKGLKEFDEWDEYDVDEDDIEDVIKTLRGVISLKEKYYNRKTDITPGITKIGGTPHLPPSLEWPSGRTGPLTFLAQINFSEIISDMEEVLPNKGIAYFFIVPEKDFDWDVSVNNQYKVLFYDGDMDQIEQSDFPQDLKKEAVIGEQLMFFSDKIAFEFSRTCIYTDGDEILEDIYSRIDDFPESKRSDNEMDKKTSDGQESYYQGKILGTPDNIQDYVEYEWSPSNDHRLLFQLNGGTFWNNSMLYFGITERDLKNRSFGRVRLILQNT